MTSGTFSGFVTAVLLAVFVYGCFWAYSSRRKSEFDEAARLPLNDDDFNHSSTQSLNKERQP
jgi:cytochrome c oxidase cbb3-type subunit 4